MMCHVVTTRLGSEKSSSRAICKRYSSGISADAPTMSWPRRTHTGRDDAHPSRRKGRGGEGGEGIISLPRPVEGWWREDTVRSVAAVVAVVGARVVRGQRRAVVAIVVRLVHRTARTFERIARGQRPVEVGDDGQLRRRRRAELPSRGAERFADVERLRLGLRARGSATAVEVVEGRGDEPHDSTTTRSRTRARKRCG